MSHMLPSGIITAYDSIEISILGSGCDVISSLLFFISYSSSSSFTAGDRFLWFECLFLSSFNWIWSQTKDQGKRRAVQSNTRSLVFVTLFPLSFLVECLQSKQCTIYCLSLVFLVLKHMSCINKTWCTIWHEVFLLHTSSLFPSLPYVSQNYVWKESRDSWFFWF